MLRNSRTSISTQVRLSRLHLRNKSDQTLDQLPPEPTTCCMSGCANCVWIEYAKEVSKVLGDVGTKVAKDKILNSVKDPNVRAFLLMELSSMSKNS